MKIYCRSGVLYLEFYQKGKRKRESLGLEDTPKNREYALKVLIPERLEESRGVPKPRPLEHYLKIVLKDTAHKKPATEKLYEHAARHALEFFGNTTIDAIRVRDIDDFVRELVDLKLKGTTIRTYLAPLSLAFNEAMRLEVIEKNPVALARLPKVQKAEKAIFSAEEARTLMSHAEGFLQRFLWIAFYTGARAGEILALEGKDFRGAYLHIRRTRTPWGYNAPKNGKERVIPLPRELVEYLNTLELQDDAPILGEKVSYQKLLHAFKKIQIDLGMTPRTPHATRHTMASLMLAARENPMLIREMLGHADLSMISHTYGHFVAGANDFKGFAEKMAL